MVTHWTRDAALRGEAPLLAAAPPTSARPPALGGSGSDRRGRLLRALALCALSVSALTAGAGCQDALTDDATGLGQAFGLGGALLARDEGGRRLWTIDWDKGAPRTRSVPFDVDAALIRDDSAGSQRLMLDRGAERLHIVKADGTVPRVVELGAPFADVQLCDDNEAAIASHLEGVASTKLVNSAEVALIDLKDAAKAPLRATVSGLSRVPLRARCTAPLTLADGSHRIIWVEARSAIGLLDLGPGGARSVVVPLTSDPSNLAIVPWRVVARPNTEGVDLYVIASGSNDVIRIAVSLIGPSLAISLDQVGVGAGPVELEVFDTSAGLRIATLNAQAKSVSLVNPATGAGFAVPLEAYYTGWTALVAADGKRQALAWRQGLPTMALIDLDQLEKKKGKAIKTLLLSNAIQDVMVHDGIAITRHPNLSAVSTVDLVTGKVSSFQGTGNLPQLLPRAGALLLRSNTPFGKTLISRIDLKTLQGTSLTWDTPTDDLLPLGGEAGLALVAPGFGGQQFALMPDGFDGKASIVQGIALKDALHGAAEREEVAP